MRLPIHYNLKTEEQSKDTDVLYEHDFIVLYCSTYLVSPIAVILLNILSCSHELIKQLQEVRSVNLDLAVMVVHQVGGALSCYCGVYFVVGKKISLQTGPHY